MWFTLLLSYKSTYFRIRQLNPYRLVVFSGILVYIYISNNRNIVESGVKHYDNNLTNIEEYHTQFIFSNTLRNVEALHKLCLLHMLIMLLVKHKCMAVLFNYLKWSSITFVMETWLEAHLIGHVVNMAFHH